MSENIIKIPDDDDYSWLEGRWQTEERDSFVAVSIAIEGSDLEGDILRLTVVTIPSGEEFVIKDLKLSGGRLCFTKILPSTGYTGFNQMERSDTPDAVRFRISYWEWWTKVQ